MSALPVFRKPLSLKRVTEPKKVIKDEEHKIIEKTEKKAENLSLPSLLRDLPEELEDGAWAVRIAKELLQNWALQTEHQGNKKIYQLVEIEFYLFNDAHEDIYAHKHDLQLETCGAWYFHRVSGASRTFSRKGLDLTFGKPDEEYGGILLRGLFDLEEGKYIEGPSKLVDRILDDFELEHVQDLLPLLDKDAFSGRLSLVPAENKFKLNKWGIGPRFGLSKKKAGKYLETPYRFHVLPQKSKKNKETLEIQKFDL